MDAFKTAEVERMRLGGNKPWKDFFNAHNSNMLAGREFESCTISERYDSEAGEEWKERLTCKVEGKEFDPAALAAVKKATGPGRSETGITPAGSGRNTPLANSRSPGAPQRTSTPSQKAQNEAYFARMGAENESRPDNLPPSQGGKFSGFGSSPMPDSSSSSGGVPGANDFQNDPVAALTKGFGWLSSTVSKQAASMNKAYIQPGMKSFEDGTFAAQARNVGMQAGTFVQQGVRNANDQFTRFVDPEHAHEGGSGGAGPAMSGTRSTTNRVQPEKKDFWDSFGQEPAGPPKEKKDFWDDFAAAGEARTQGGGAKAGTSIGTSAMKNTGGGGAKKKEDDGWGDW